MLFSLIDFMSLPIFLSQIDWSSVHKPLAILYCKFFLQILSFEQSSTPLHFSIITKSTWCHIIIGDQNANESKWILYFAIDVMYSFLEMLDYYNHLFHNTFLHDLHYTDRRQFCDLMSCGIFHCLYMAISYSYLFFNYHCSTYIIKELANAVKR